MLETDKPNREIAIDAIHALTDKPTITITVDRPPKTFLQKAGRLIGLYKSQHFFNLRALKTGTMYRIAALTLTIPDEAVATINKGTEDAPPGAFLPLFHAHVGTLVEIVALAITNTEKEPNAALKRLIREEFDMPMMLQVIQAVSYQMHLSNFLNSIDLITNQSELPGSSRGI